MSVLQPQQTDNALHTAVSLGLAYLAREIVDIQPDLAIAFNQQGLTPMHLAVSNGNLEVVHNLLKSKVGSDLCLLRDNYGLLPIHTAVIKGRVSILMELIHSYPSSLLREPITCQQPIVCHSDSILHLAIKSECFAAVEFLVSEVGWDEYLLNLANGEGDTVLHLAARSRQPKMVKLLISNPRMNVFAVNDTGSTALGILEQWPNEQRDTSLDAMICTAATTSHQRRVTSTYCWHSFWAALFFLKKINAPSQQRHDDKYQETRNTLLVVNALVATFTFQAALTSPGGFAQESDAGKDGLQAGEALLDNHLKIFLGLDSAAFYLSLFVMLIILTLDTKTSYEIRALMLITLIAVNFAGFTFFDAVTVIYRHTRVWILFTKFSWMLITMTIAGIIFIRFLAFTWRKRFWFEKKMASLEEAAVDVRMRMKTDNLFLHHPKVIRQGYWFVVACTFAFFSLLFNFIIWGPILGLLYRLGWWDNLNTT